MSKQQEQKLAKLLDEAINVAQSIWGINTTKRWRCPEYIKHGYNAGCYDRDKPPLSHELYCPKHGEKIIEAETDEYSTQKWQSKIEVYLYDRKFDDD